MGEGDPDRVCGGELGGDGQVGESGLRVRHGLVREPGVGDTRGPEESWEATLDENSEDWAGDVWEPSAGEVWAREGAPNKMGEGCSTGDERGSRTGLGELVG